MKDESEKLNITPPEFPDPLLPPTPGPGSEGEAKDAYLGEVAKDNLAAAEALGPDNVEPEPEGDHASRVQAVVDAAEPIAEAMHDALLGPAGDSPIDVLRGIAIGTIDPGSTQSVRGAAVEYSPRNKAWRPALVLRVCGIDKAGNVLVDLTSQTDAGGAFDVFDAPLGSGVGNWRFPLG